MAAVAPTATVARSAATNAPPGRSKRRQLGTAAFFLFPSLVGVLVFLVVPVILVILLSFVRWDLLSPPKFVGFSNFTDLFQYDQVGHSLLVTLYYVVLNIPIQTVIALGLALMLNRKMPAMGFFRVLYVLPFLATPVAMAVVWNWVFDPKVGVINSLLSLVGIHGPSWLGSSAWSMPVIAFANIWQYAGYNMLFFLAGLQAIPKQLYEVSGMDGAGRIQQFFRITLPLLNPTLLFVLVTGFIGSFQVFDMVYVLTNGGPGDATEVMNLKIYQSAFVGFHIGEACAMSVILFLIILTFTIVQFAYFRRRTTYEMN
ncbi:MAG TPA: sugar ABC transporter permease [Mycobacteriales bacterium]|jgi:multiple sugar transport system permease protein/sn-glycerol 3-phosphate transport system permease protein|nr:sugar ABC transporter permease [Mycobacteriales bacterium]